MTLSTNDTLNTNLLPLNPANTTSQDALADSVPLGYGDVGACGMWQVMVAVMQNVTAIQEYDSAGLIPLSTAVENSNVENANYWLGIMSAGLPTNDPTAMADYANIIKSSTPPSYPLVLHGANGKTYTLSDQQSIQAISAWMDQSPSSRASQASVLMQEATTGFNTHNTMYSQANSFWSGINNGLNQSSSDTAQTIQIVLQMYQQGPGAQMQTLAQII